MYTWLNLKKEFSLLNNYIRTFHSFLQPTAIKALRQGYIIVHSMYYDITPFPGAGGEKCQYNDKNKTVVPREPNPIIFFTFTFIHLIIIKNEPVKSKTKTLSS